MSKLVTHFNSDEMSYIVHNVEKYIVTKCRFLQKLPNVASDEMSGHDLLSIHIQ